MTSRVIVVLGVGYVGTAAARHFADRGDEVYTVRRSSNPPDGVLRGLRGDIGSPDSIIGLPKYLDYVILALAPGATGDDYRSTYVRGAAGAVEIARRHGARSLVYTSSTGVYGVEDGRWVTEDTAVTARHPNAEALIDAERVLLEADDLGVTVLRVAGIYGHGRNPVHRYSRPAELPARGRYYVNLAHLHDIVSAIELTATEPAAPRVLNCSDGRPELALEVARWTLGMLGHPWPEPLVFTRPDVPSRSNQRVSSAALQAMGWVPQYPSFREGFRALHQG